MNADLVRLAQEHQRVFAVVPVLVPDAGIRKGPIKIKLWVQRILTVRVELD